MNEQHCQMRSSQQNLFRNHDLVKAHYLEDPDIVKILKEIKNRLNIDIDPFQDDIKEAILEIERKDYGK